MKPDKLTLSLATSSPSVANGMSELRGRGNDNLFIAMINLQLSTLPVFRKSKFS
jgi:hypothetical protein